MAGEIYCSFDSAEILYALIYRPSDSKIYDEGDDDFEPIGTWNDARAGECNIEMTAVGDMHIANFPTTIDAGVYIVSIRKQLSAVADTPDTDDPPVAQGIMHWDGTAEITYSTLDTNIDLILTELQRVNNVYDETQDLKEIAVIRSL
jgi:hypothetical protein